MVVHLDLARPGVGEESWICQQVILGAFDEIKSIVANLCFAVAIRQSDRMKLHAVGQRVLFQVATDKAAERYRRLERMYACPLPGEGDGAVADIGAHIDHCLAGQITQIQLCVPLAQTGSIQSAWRTS